MLVIMTQKHYSYGLLTWGNASNHDSEALLVWVTKHGVMLVIMTQKRKHASLDTTLQAIANGWLSPIVYQYIYVKSAHPVVFIDFISS